MGGHDQHASAAIDAWFCGMTSRRKTGDHSKEGQPSISMAATPIGTRSRPAPGFMSGLVHGDALALRWVFVTSIDLYPRGLPKVVAVNVPRRFLLPLGSMRLAIEYLRDRLRAQRASKLTAQWLSSRG